MVFPLMYELWAFPYRLALESPSDTSQQFAFDVAMDVMIVMDIIVQLRTAVPVHKKGDARTRDASGVQWITSFEGIAKRYFTRVFPVEIVPGGFYYVATMSLIGQPELGHGLASWRMWVWWLSTVGRLVPRYVRLMAWWEGLKTNLQVQLKMLQGMKFAVIIFMAVHWVGCFCWFVARINQLDSSTWINSVQTTLPFYDRFDPTIPATHYVSPNHTALCKPQSHCPIHASDLLCMLLLL